MKRKLLSLILPVLGAIGCFPNYRTNLSDWETDNHFTENCVAELNDYMLGDKPNELTDCLIDIFAETSEIPPNTDMIMAETDEIENYLDNCVADGPCEGLCESDGITNTIYVRPGIITTLLETGFHEIGHLDKQPKDSAIGNHLKAELYPTTCSINLARLLYEHEALFEENEYVSHLPFMIMLPTITLNELQDDPNTEYDETRQTFLLADAIHDKNLGAWRNNYDYILAEAAINLRILDNYGDVFKAYEEISKTNYPKEYAFVDSTYEDYEGYELYDELRTKREKAQKAVTNYIETTDYADMAQYAYWFEYY